MRLVLGSASPRRKAILASLGEDFSVVTADIDEKGIRHDSARELTLLLARAKSDAIRKRLSDDTYLITADSVVTFGNRIYEKSSSVAESRDFLLSFQNSSVSVVTSLIVVNTATGERREVTDEGFVHFSTLPDDVLEQASHNGYTEGTAGGFDINDSILKPYITTTGDSGTIIGLSPQILKEMLVGLSFTFTK